jgi:hypothetical protein
MVAGKVFQFNSFAQWVVGTELGLIVVVDAVIIFTFGAGLIKI